MSEQELIVAVVAITSGVGFATFFFSQIFKLIRLSIEKRHGTQEARDMQLREEFVKFRKQMEQRISTLEASQIGASNMETDKSLPKIALPEPELEQDSDRLPNMLRQKA